MQGKPRIDLVNRRVSINKAHRVAFAADPVERKQVEAFPQRRAIDEQELLRALAVRRCAQRIQHRSRAADTRRDREDTKIVDAEMLAKFVALAAAGNVRQQFSKVGGLLESGTHNGHGGAIGLHEEIFSLALGREVETEHSVRDHGQVDRTSVVDNARRELERIERLACLLRSRRMDFPRNSGGLF